MRIFFTQPTPTAPGAAPLPSGTPAPSPTFLTSVLDLAGETTLAQAQQQANFTIQQPTFPADLGTPNHVYLQELGGQVVVLVWMAPDHPQQVRMSLSETSSNQYIFSKYQTESVLNTEVEGQDAVWVAGRYLLVTRSGDTTFTRLVKQGHTLIWTAGQMTYRLETDEDLAAALRIAQSIQ